MEIGLNNIINTAIVIVASLLIYQGIKFTLNKSRKIAISKSLMSDDNTYFFMIKSTLKFIYVLIVILVLLQVNGIDVSGMLAGVGIASVIIGLAVQDALKDIIRGITIISENYFKIGDVIKVGTNTGKVIELGIKTTKIKDLYNDNIVSIANRNIEKVELISTTINLDIPLPHEVNLKKAEKIIKEMAEAIKEVKKVTGAEYRGVTDIKESSINYRLYVACKPENTVIVRRIVLGIVLKILEKNKVPVPHEQLDIHNK